MEDSVAQRARWMHDGFFTQRAQWMEDYFAQRARWMDDGLLLTFAAIPLAGGHAVIRVATILLPGSRLGTFGRVSNYGHRVFYGALPSPLSC